jgi:magnesium-transporting ATPase (P-type)
MGIGIHGREGNQAAAFSDFAVQRFKDMRRLMFWHGRRISVRTQEYTMICMFKSLVMAFTKIFANMRAGFTGFQP